MWNIPLWNQRVGPGGEALTERCNISPSDGSRDGHLFGYPVNHCYVSRQTYTEVKNTYSEGGTHKETQCPQSKAKVRARDKGAESQPDELWIHKIDTVIVQNKNGEMSTG